MASISSVVVVGATSFTSASGTVFKKYTITYDITVSGSADLKIFYSQYGDLADPSKDLLIYETASPVSGAPTDVGPIDLPHKGLLIVYVTDSGSPATSVISIPGASAYDKMFGPKLTTEYPFIPISGKQPLLTPDRYSETKAYPKTISTNKTKIKYSFAEIAGGVRKYAYYTGKKGIPTTNTTHTGFTDDAGVVWTTPEDAYDTSDGFAVAILDADTSSSVSVPASSSGYKFYGGFPSQGGYTKLVACIVLDTLGDTTGITPKLSLRKVSDQSAVGTINTISVVQGLQRFTYTIPSSSLLSDYEILIQVDADSSGTKIFKFSALYIETTPEFNTGSIGVGSPTYANNKKPSSYSIDGVVDYGPGGGQVNVSADYMTNAYDFSTPNDITTSAYVTLTDIITISVTQGSVVYDTFGTGVYTGNLHINIALAGSETVTVTDTSTGDPIDPHPALSKYHYQSNLTSYHLNALFYSIDDGVTYNQIILPSATLTHDTLASGSPVVSATVARTNVSVSLTSVDLAKLSVKVVAEAAVRDTFALPHGDTETDDEYGSSASVYDIYLT